MLHLNVYSMQYVAQQTSIEVGKIDIVLIKELNPSDNSSSSDIMAISKLIVGDPCMIEIHKVNEHQTLGEIQEMCGFSQRNLVSSLKDNVNYSRNMSTIFSSSFGATIFITKVKELLPKKKDNTGLKLDMKPQL